MLSDLGPTTFARLIETIAVPESLFFYGCWLARPRK